MKTSKSPENKDLTPSKKKLKQGTLPFKPKNEVTPSSTAPVTRKRKLSDSEDVTLPKVGKICKENGVIEDSVVISDDDSKDCEKSHTDVKTPNPFVKLVDTAWKKKLQKAKKKKGDKKKVVKKINNEDVDNSAISKDLESDLMDVDEPHKVPDNEVDSNVNENQCSETELSSNKINDNCGSETSDVVVLEDSNNAEDKPVTNSTEELSSNEASSQNSVMVASPTKLDNESGLDTNKNSPSKTDSSITNATQVTPKRSTRNKAKSEPNNNSKGSPASELNDSVQSNSKTPKTSRSSSVTNSQGDVSLNESTTSANLTPKQLQKKLESAKKKEEREKDKLEREKKRQQEKDERAKQRQEKEEQKRKEREEKEEAKKKEKEEKEELKKKEREEKEKLRELEKKQKEEKEEQRKKEREEKEEQRKKEKEAREEEKRKKQEALELEKQEQELKKKKAAEAFVNFFVPKQKTDKEQATTSCLSKTNLLSNFTIKSDMRLAPLVRANISEEQKEELVRLIEKQGVDKGDLYLKSLKNCGYKPQMSGKTWPYSADDDDVVLIEDELPPVEGAGEILNCEPPLREKLRPKLFSFHENRRPPYWGTWRKKSSSVKPRKPFGQDEKQLDYEVDSDEDWEEEQEGESLDGSAAGSDDEQDGDEYEVDNVLFVPHGYLSDEEATMDEDDVLSLSPEAQKAKLKHLEDEFESEMKKPTEKLKPRLYGLLWETEDGGKPDNCVDALWNYFGKLSMIMSNPLLQPSPESEEVEKKKVKKKKPVTDTEKSPKTDKKKKAKTVEKEGKSPKVEVKKNAPETKKNQPGINMFLTKVKSS